MTRLDASLRIVIAAGSVGGFLGGWALLSHANKPVEAQAPAQSESAPEAAPLPTLAPRNSGPSRVQPLPNLQLPRSTGQFRLRTRGS